MEMITRMTVMKTIRLMTSLGMRCVYVAGPLGQMNRCLATLVIEAVASDRGKSAGHVGGLLVMPLLPLHGKGDHLDLLVALLLLVFVRVMVIRAGLVVCVRQSLG